MTIEARLGFLIIFFSIWCLLGLIPWAAAAVLSRGRGALPALPLALLGAALFGLAVPLAGQRDVTGFLISLATAFLGGGLFSALGVSLGKRLFPLEAPPEATTTDPPDEEGTNAGP
jgi:hypothetical protein